MTANRSDDAYVAWLDSLRALLESPESARRWRQHRYQFSHRLGEALAARVDGKPPVTGSAIYGIWLEWGLIYVGQTTDAARRLRDLPIGESHHLATTFPPEVWHKVVVIAWPQLPSAAGLVDQLGNVTVGLALEYLLQLRANPLANEARRTGRGEWRLIDRTRSLSAGAKAASQVSALFEELQEVWELASSADRSQDLPTSARCIFPARLLAQG